MFHLLWDEISKAGYEKSLNSGLVLTGGGSQLDGLSEIAEQIFDLPIRRGTPAGVGGLADHVSNPAFATAVGLVLYAARHRAPATSSVGGGALTRVMGRLKTVFKEFF
jgi:cell division protein FtsA